MLVILTCTRRAWCQPCPCMAYANIHMQHLCHTLILVFFQMFCSVRPGGCKINTKHCLHLALLLQWSHYVQSSVCFADETPLKSKEKLRALPAERPRLSWNKQTNMGRERIKKRGWNTGVSLGPALTILHRKQPCHDTMRESERERNTQRECEGPVAGRQVSDSFAMLVGYSATMPSSLQSSIKEDTCS